MSDMIGRNCTVRATGVTEYEMVHERSDVDGTWRVVEERCSVCRAIQTGPSKEVCPSCGRAFVGCIHTDRRCDG